MPRGKPTDQRQGEPTKSTLVRFSFPLRAITFTSVHVLVMAKSPVPGQVKTRLCPPCSPVEAAEIAAAALADTLAAAAACGATRKLLALDGAPGDWIPPGYDVFPQRGVTFNDRLTAAWADADGPGVQIGMDTPQVTAAMLDEALARIGPGRAQLGYAEDGGWWALGLEAPHAGAFTDVPMSAADTGRRQHEQLTTLGLSVDMLATLRDIDHFSDALAVAAMIPESALATTVQRLQKARPTKEPAASAIRVLRTS